MSAPLLLVSLNSLSYCRGSIIQHTLASNWHSCLFYFREDYLIFLIIYLFFFFFFVVKGQNCKKFFLKFFSLAIYMLESYLLILYRLIFNDFFKISSLLSLLSYRSYNFIKFEEIKWAKSCTMGFSCSSYSFSFLSRSV